VGDFGDELYFDWQVSRGQVIGRDLVYTFGPLSLWFNAVLMRLVSPSVNVILIANLLILILIALLLYRLLLEAFGELAAFAGMAFFLGVFAFGSGTYAYNYNFLTPYSHGATHGFLFCLAAIHCILRFGKGGGLAWLALAGLITGAAFLTKPELFIACFATFVLGAAGACWMRRTRLAVFNWITILISLAAAPLIAWLCLRTSAVLGGWQYIFHGVVTANRFYRTGMGIDYPLPRLARLGVSMLIDTAALGLIVVCAWMIPLDSIPVGLAAGAITCAATLGVGVLLPRYWTMTDLALAPFALGAMAVSGWFVLNRRAADENAPARLARWCLAVLAVFLLAKMPMNTRTVHYGFVLAAPAATLAAAALVRFLPEVSGRAGAKPRLVRFIALGLLAGLIANRIALENWGLVRRTTVIPLVFGGALQAQTTDEPAAEAVAWLRNQPSLSTIAALPDASGILYAAGLSSGIAYNVLNPVNLDMWGEDAPLGSLENHPPQLILLDQSDWSEMGARSFGQDFGIQIMAWIRARYTPVGIFGEPGRLGSIQVWARR
jgi:hypothetical protein